MKTKKSMRLVSVLLSVLMLMSVFTVISASAEGEVYSLSLACNLKTAGFNRNNTETAVQNSIKQNFVVETHGCVANKDNINLVYKSGSSWILVNEEGKKIQSDLRYAIRCRIELTDNSVWREVFKTGEFDEYESYAEFKDGTKNMEGEEYKAIENENIYYEERTNAVWLIIPLYGNMIFSGTDGGCEWSYDESNYTLDISGTVIPDYYESDDEKVHHAPWYKFDVRKLNLKEGVTRIGDSAFPRVNITTFTAPSSLKEIGVAAFNGVLYLTTVSLKNVEVLEDQAFGICPNLKKVTMNKVKSMGFGTFGYDDSLTEITIPSCCKKAVGAFYETPLKKITFYSKTCVLTGNVEVPLVNNSTYTYNIYDNAIAKKAVIHCYYNSTAYKYAKTYKRNFKYINAKISPTSLNINAGGTRIIGVTGCRVTKWKTAHSVYALAVTEKKTKDTKCTVYGFRKGTATVTAVLDDGTKLSCKVNTKTSPRLEKTKVTVKKGGTASVQIIGKAKIMNNSYLNTKIAKITSPKTANKITVKGHKKGITTLCVKVNGLQLGLKVIVK
ncbi:MAG: leucine-rich repeat domain-containing protein [Ruminococcus sp.]|nr:leucine-rich repeat domain-containing protein [Ruminococcus sp.]